MSRLKEYVLLDSLFDELFPLLRSITGPGIEQSYKIFCRHMPLNIFGVPSNTQIFDWLTPEEWHCQSATLTGPDGETICDITASNLHVVNYSEAVNKTLSLTELQQYLHSLPHLPDAIPYVTSYYKRTWGFCLTQRQRDTLKEGIYHAQINAEFREGRVPLADTILTGESEREIVLSSYLCHPSLANNELSGPLVLLGLYRRIASWKNRRHTFRFVFNPETIGSLCYLSIYGQHLREKMDAGLVLTCLGGPGDLSYKQSRRENARVDRLVGHWIDRGESISMRSFTPASGSDERQYCSPGFNLPMGQFSRTVYGEYAGYHNSLDNKQFMTIDALLDSIDEIEQFLRELDQVGSWINLAPYGEPQLGRRGLYPNLNSANTWKASSDDQFDDRTVLERILNVLSYSDGQHDLIDISRRSGCTVRELLPIVHRLHTEGILSFQGGA